MEAAARLDSDNDGFPNCQEYLCGTDPNDPASRFTAHISFENGAPVVSWSPTNRLASYEVLGKDSLEGAGNWTPVPAENGADKRFFKVRINQREQ